VSVLRHARGRSFWSLYLLVGATASVGYHVVGSVELQTVVAIGLTLGALVALIVGVRLHQPRTRLPWYLLGLGQTAALGSWILWQHAILAGGAPPAAGSVADLLWVVNAVAGLGAIVLLLRAREPGVAALLDSGIVTCGLALVTWIALLAPALEAHTGRAGPPQVTYAFLDVAMLAVLARLAARRSVRTSAGALLLAGVVALLGSDVLYVWLTASGAYAPGAWGDLGWLLFHVLVGSAALHPSMAKLYEPGLKRDDRLSPPYLGLLAAASLSVPGLIAFDVVGGEGVNSPVVLALATALALLVLGRLAGLIRQGERLRGDLAAQNTRLTERTAAIELLREIADATDDSTSTDEALARAIDAICAATGWPLGHAYMKERGFPQLAPTRIWHADDAERWAPFVRLTETLHFVAGHGLPGHVLERAEPVWAPSISHDPTLPRAALARELGLRTGFAFPVLVDGEVAAVLEFYTPDELEPNLRLTELSTAVGSQLARVLERARAEEALRASKVRFRGLVANVPGAIYRTSLQGGRTVEYVSEHIEQITGYPAADFVSGRISPLEIIHPDDVERVDAAIHDALERRLKIELEYRMVHADGTVHWVSENGRVLQDEVTGESWFDGVVVDVTERKRADEELRRLALIVESSGDAIIGLTLEGHVTSWNAAAEALTGYSVEEMTGRHISRVLPEDRHEDLPRVRDLLLAGERVQGFETKLLRRSGETRDISLSVALISGETGLAVTVRDITAAKDAEERLREAEERYRILVEQLPVITYIDLPGEADADLWRPSYVSPRLQGMLGWTPDEWLSDPLFYYDRIVHPDDKAWVIEAHDVAFDEQEGHTIEHRLLHRDGSVRWFVDHMVIARDKDERPLWSQGYLLDITERKEAERRLREAETRYAAIVESSDDAIVGLTPEGVVTSFNAGAERLYGYSAEEMIGRHAGLLIPPELREFERGEIHRRLSTGEHVRQLETERVRRDRSRVPISLTISPIKDAEGKRIGASGIARDITEQKRAEAELERLLERERAQNAELRTLDTMKDEFIALVSHELRTPLTSIRGYLELVTDGGAGELSEEQQHFLGVVARNAERLQSLVGDLLFVAQIEAGRLQLESGPVELEQIAAEAVETGRPVADQKGIELTLLAEPVPTLEGDRGRLGQLLDNFVSNALKFTPEGGSVEVRLREEENRAVLEVSDTGMGIPEAEQERLFERFFRSSTATAQAIQGTGLGLAISKAIAEAHGGRITFTSVENDGTTFRIEFPLEATSGMAKVA
jgi:PAS domain S-box-containing protein